MSKLIAAAMALSCGFLAPSAHAGCGNSSDPWAVVHAQDLAYNAHDVDAFAECYSNDIIISNLAGEKPIVGIPALKGTYSFLKTAPKDFHTIYLNKIINGPIVIVLEQAFNPPKKNWSEKSIAIYEVRNGKIVHLWIAPHK